MTITAEQAAKLLEGTTPGPWLIETATKGYEVCTVHQVTRQPTEDGLGQAWVYVRPERTTRNGEWYWPEPDEQLVNARLIAAAPDLARALIASEAARKLAVLRTTPTDEQLCRWIIAMGDWDAGGETAIEEMEALLDARAAQPICAPWVSA